MRSLHNSTELLEFFEWNEDRCQKAINDFSNCVNGLNLKDRKDIASVENKVYRQMKAGDWTEGEVAFLLEYLKKQLKDEILYEERHVVNK